jgi:hypothetical protein
VDVAYLVAEIEATGVEFVLEPHNADRGVYFEVCLWFPDWETAKPESESN